MKFEKKAVIFDLDGVICFTDKFHYTFTNNISANK